MVLSMVREMLKGGADVHFGSSDDLERPEYNPTVIAMLGAAGLNGVDIQLFDKAGRQFSYMAVLFRVESVRDLMLTLR